jgi:hypothetical protein
LGQGQFPGFTDQVLTEAMVGLFMDKPEPCFLINMPGRPQNAIRPERYFPVTGTLGEFHTFTHQSGADAHASRVRFNDE